MRATRTADARSSSVSTWVSASGVGMLLERGDRAVGQDPLAHAGEQLAGAGLDEVAHAGGVQGEHRLAPAHGAHERLGQLGADVLEGPGGRAGDDGEARLADLDLVER